MGENWIQKKKKQYRHQLQNGASTLTLPTVYEGFEEVEKEYIAHLDKGLNDVVAGMELGIFMLGKRARPALVTENDVIGYVEGDSAGDIQSQLDDVANWPVLLRVRVVRRDSKSDTIIISPISEKPRKR